jgi:hypothetical protein
MSVNENFCELRNRDEEGNYLNDQLRLFKSTPSKSIRIVSS